MRAFISVNKGFEILFDSHKEIAAEEKLDGAVIAQFDSLHDICVFIYRTQLANSVGLLLDRKKRVEDLKLGEDFESLIRPQSTFRITSRIGYEDEVGSLFKGYKVDLKNPTFNIVLNQIEDEFFLLLDLSSDLSKREYKIFNNPLSIKGTTAFGTLMLAGYVKGQSLLNPFCNSGTLEIEAALYNSGLSTRFYNKQFPFTRLNIDEKELASIFKEVDSKSKQISVDITAADPQLRNITAAKKNAKIAGVDKSLSFRRIDIDWMDIKHEEKTFDLIITFLPGSSKHKSPTVQLKEFDQLFYQAEYIMKKNGSVAILCFSKDLLIEAASKYLKLSDVKEFQSGTQSLELLIFKKK